MTAGFFLPHVVAWRIIPSHRFDGTFDGIQQIPLDQIPSSTIRPHRDKGHAMALTDTFMKQVKATGKPAGDKYTGGGAWRLGGVWCGAA